MRFLGGASLLVLALAISGCNKNDDTGVQNPDPDAAVKKLEVITEGDGPAVEEGDTAYVLYRGTQMVKNDQGVEEEKQFDTNMDDVANQVPLQVINALHSGVVTGFKDSVAQMKVGDRIKWEIPWELAYGAQGSPPNIPPYADLMFEIELLYVLKKGEEAVFDILEDIPGTGPVANPGDTVAVHYKATYLTGKLVDDTHQRGATADFILGDRTAVIPGINGAMGGIPDIGVQSMRAGGKRTVILPDRLVFGASGNQHVQGRQPIKFEIELVSVNGQS